MKYNLSILFATIILFSGCIKDDFIDDFVDATLRINNIPDTIKINTSFQFEFQYLNNIGLEEDLDGQWSSSDPDIVTIDNSGLATALTVGKTDVSVQVRTNDTLLIASTTVYVGQNTVSEAIEKSGTIRTTSTYLLEGSFSLREEGGNLTLRFEDDYRASTALPGLYVYLTNNPNSTNSALEIGAVTTFSGAHTYTIEDVDISEYQYILYFCKPFNVEVGEGLIE